MLNYGAVEHGHVAAPGRRRLIALCLAGAAAILGPRALSRRVAGGLAALDVAPAGTRRVVVARHCVRNAGAKFEHLVDGKNTSLRDEWTNKSLPDFSVGRPRGNKLHDAGP